MTETRIDDITYYRRSILYTWIKEIDAALDLIKILLRVREPNEVHISSHI